MPPVLYEETVSDRVAGRRMATVQNPFSFYIFQGPIPSDFEDVEDPQGAQIAYLSAWRRTYRYAESSPSLLVATSPHFKSALKSRQGTSVPRRWTFLGHAALLLGVGEWAGQVFTLLDRGTRGGAQEAKRAAAGVVLEVDELTLKWRRSMVDVR
ncbi:hypothetical protein F5I97DRAFT_1847038 [Phlebopus sp. FC_14]|nr:hypothetical protein F5I97DRAFT_1847038 [Phlebopus sp. FC_14]